MQASESQTSGTTSSVGGERGSEQSAFSGQRQDFSRIGVAEFAEATFSAVLRANEARRVSVGDKPIFKGPIIYGIWWWPDGMPPDFSGPMGTGGGIGGPG